MRVSVVVCVYKQAQNWRSVLGGLEAQTQPPDDVVVVLDRPADGPEWIPEWRDRSAEDVEARMREVAARSSLSSRIHIERVEDLPEPARRDVPSGRPLFLAGDRRNRGARLAEARGAGLILFIDGDCVPDPGLVAAHARRAATGLPILAVGRRREQAHDWRDRREYDARTRWLFEKRGWVVHDLDLVQRSLVVWSCNLSLSAAGVRRLYAFNRFYYGRDELFCADFSGRWGGEDSFLGVVAHYAHVVVATIGEPDTGIRHIDHPRPETEYGNEHFEFLIRQYRELERRIAERPMPLELLAPPAGATAPPEVPAP